jgi:hypothetical protein
MISFLPDQIEKDTCKIVVGVCVASFSLLCFRCFIFVASFSLLHFRCFIFVASFSLLHFRCFIFVASFLFVPYLLLLYSLIE